MIGAVQFFSLFHLSHGYLNSESYLSKLSFEISSTISWGTLLGFLLSAELWKLFAIVVLAQAFGVACEFLLDLPTVVTGNLRRESGFFTYPLELAVCMSAFLPLLALAAQRETRPIQRLVATGFGIGGVVLGILTGYRLISVALILPSMLMRKWNGIRPVVPWLITIAVLLSASFLLRHSSPATASSTNYSTTGRAQLNRQALNAFLANPVFGVGFGGLNMTATGTPIESPELAAERDQIVYKRVNSLYLQILAEGGVLGALWLLMLIGSFVKLNRNLPHGPPRIASLGALLLIGLTDISFGYASNKIGNIVLGYLVAVSLMDSRNRAMSPNDLHPPESSSVNGIAG